MTHLIAADTAPERQTVSFAVRGRGLVKTYGRGDTVVHALDHTDLDIPVGTFTAIMGPSGSGKSTIASLLQRLYEPTSGTITIGDTSETRWMDVHHLRDHVSVLESRVAALTRDKTLLMDRCEMSIAASSHHSNKERQARLECEALRRQVQELSGELEEQKRREVESPWILLEEEAVLQNPLMMIDVMTYETLTLI